MKNLSALMICTLALAAFVGCRVDPAKKAARVAIEHARNITKGDYDRFVEEIRFAPGDDAVVKQAQKDYMKKALKEQVHPVILSKGGIKTTNVVDHTLSPDGKRATVTLNHIYNNGQNDDMVYDLVNVDNKWQVDMSRHREVWHTMTPDHQPLTIKLKESDNREVMKLIEGDQREVVKLKEGDEKEVLKVKDGDQKEVLKMKEQADGDIVIKKKVDGHKEVSTIKAE